MKTHNIKFILATAVLAVPTFAGHIFSDQASAWGPERTTYTNESPAPSATFNSITNNAAVGDEREFVRIREKGSGKHYTANTDGSGFLVEPGKAYEVYIYYHNDAASNTNETGEGVAIGVKLSTHFTYLVTPSETGYVDAKITGTNTTPAAVWDDLKLISNENVTLNYVANSATIHNSWGTNDMILVADNLFSDDGAYLGVDSLNGVVFGCAEFSGYVTYELQAEDKETPTPTPTPDPETPTCATNPEMEGCSTLPETGPLEITLAVVVILGIAFGLFYYFRVRKNLKTATSQVTSSTDAHISQGSQAKPSANSSAPTTTPSPENHSANPEAQHDSSSDPHHEQ